MQTTVSTKIVEKRNNCGGLKLLFLFNILIIWLFHARNKKTPNECYWKHLILAANLKFNFETNYKTM